MRRFPEETRADIRKAMDDGSRELLEEVQSRAPVDEGKLKANAHRAVSRDGLSAVVGYSPKRSGFRRKWLKGGFTSLWQEFGAQQHAAQPFLRPAFRARLHGIIARIDKAVNDSIRKAQDYGK